MEAVCADKGYRLWTLSEELLGLDPASDWCGPRHLGRRTDELDEQEQEEEDVLLQDLDDIEEVDLEEEGFEYID